MGYKFQIEVTKHSSNYPPSGPVTHPIQEKSSLQCIPQPGRYCGTLYTGFEPTWCQSAPVYFVGQGCWPPIQTYNTPRLKQCIFG